MIRRAGHQGRGSAERAKREENLRKWAAELGPASLEFRLATSHVSGLLCTKEGFHTDPAVQQQVVTPQCQASCTPLK